MSGTCSGGSEALAGAAYGDRRPRTHRVLYLRGPGVGEMGQGPSVQLRSCKRDGVEDGAQPDSFSPDLICSVLMVSPGGPWAADQG